MPINDYDCTYCGMTATDRDHVLPHSYSHGSEQLRTSEHDTVLPACRECNTLLSNLMYTTIAKRAEYISTTLTSRYRKLIHSPEWSEEDYSELTGRLLKEIRYQQRKKKVVLARIAYAQGVAKLENLDPLSVWQNADAKCL